MTHSECPQQCTAFGGSARRKRSGSTIGSYCRISSARLRVLCSPIVRKTLLEVAKWRHLDLPRCLPRQKRNDSDVVRRCGDATRAGHAQEAGQLVIFVGAGGSIGHPSDLPSFGRLTEIIRDESELNDVIDDALFWVGMRAGVVGLVAVAFSNEVGTITTLSKCSSKLAMLTGNGQRTLAVR
jgi:hypothetical protein